MANLNSLISAIAQAQKSTIPNPWAGYAPGTKLLNKIKQEEEAKQNEIKNQADAAAAIEQKRQFDEELAENKRAHNLTYQASLNSGGGGGGGGGGSLTEGQAQRMATSSLLNWGTTQYARNKQSRGSSDAKIANSAAAQHPLFYAINSALYDPSIQGDVIDYGADQVTALRGIISGATQNGKRITPEEYIAYLEASNNKAYKNQAAELKRILKIEY